MARKVTHFVLGLKPGGVCSETSEQGMTKSRVVINFIFVQVRFLCYLPNFNIDDSFYRLVYSTRHQVTSKL